MLYIYASHKIYIYKIGIKYLLTKYNDISSIWKSNRNLRQLQGSPPFPSSRMAPSGVDSFSRFKILSSKSHRKESHFSAVRLLNRDIVTFYSQWNFSWNTNWGRMVWELSKSFKHHRTIWKEQNVCKFWFFLFQFKKNYKSS